ncbi:MAG: Crp/Fnr family transcriptional regulator [Chitinophagales bacterium]
MEAFKRYLQQFPNYTPSVFEKVLPYLSEKRLKSGDFFLREGKICRSIAFIEEGLLRLYYLNDGKEITNCFCRKHSITCSYTSLITQQASETSIQAIEPSKLIVLSYESVQKFYQEDLFWQQVSRLASENEYIVTESHNRFLRDLSATERYLQILENDSELLQRVPLNYLSTYLQIAPETLSRIRKKVARN